MNPKDKASPVKKTGLASKLFSSAQSTEKSLIPDGKQTLDDSLTKLYKLTKKNFDEEKKTNETFRSFEKVKEREKTKRHDEFVKVLSGVLKQNKATAKAAAEEIARLQQELSQAKQGVETPQIPRIPGKGAPKTQPKPKTEAPKVETKPQPKTEAPKVETKPQPKTEAPKVETKPQPKTEPAAPKPEAPKPQAPKPEAPKPEAPKSQAPKPEAPKPEAPAPKPQTQTPAQTQPVPKQTTVKPESLPPAPKPQAPKPEAPKPQAPKPEAPKPEAPKPQTQPQTQAPTQPSATTQPVPKQSTVKPESIPAPKPSATPAPKPSAPSAGQTASKVATGAAAATTAALAGKEALAANIAKYESTGSSGRSFGGNEYNAYNKGTSGNKMIPADVPIDFSKMTIKEYLRRGALKSGDPDKLFAVGRYQIIPKTMEGLVKSLKIDPNTTYLDPSTQDLLFSKGLTTSVAGRGAVDDYINGKPGATRDAAIMALAKEFASVGVPHDTKRGDVTIKKGQSYYSGLGGNKAHNSPEEVGAALDADRTKKLNSTSTPQQLPSTTGAQINEASRENKDLKNASPQNPVVVNNQTTVIQKGGNNNTDVHQRQNDKPLHQR